MGTLDRKRMARLLGNLSWGLNALHLLLALLYVNTGAGLLVAAHLLCAAVGDLGIWLLRKERYRAHFLALYCSELGMLTVSALCVGWSAGLQLPLVGLTALVFLAEYLLRSLNLPRVPALPLSAVNLAVYAAAFLPWLHRPGLLSVPQSTVTTVEIVWSALAFVFLIFGLYVVLRLTSDSEQILADKAETDELTWLINRAGYDRLCTETELRTTTLLLVDVDKFKGINDRFGHETGDRVLKKIAGELKRNFRQQDRVCRIGGDEFAIMMLQTETAEEVLIKNKIARINRELSHNTDDGLPYVSVSVGAAHGSEAQDWVALFKQADNALYQVKAAGGRGCEVFAGNRQ